MTDPQDPAEALASIQAARARMVDRVDACKPKKARWIAFGLLAVLLPLLGLAIWSRYGGPWWLSLAAAGVAWPVTVIGSRWWGRVWRRELRETT